MMPATRALVATAVSSVIATAVIVAAPSPVAAYPASCRQTFTGSAAEALPSAVAVSEVPVAVAGHVADVDVRLWTGDVQSASFAFGPSDGAPSSLVTVASLGGNVELSGAVFDDEAAGPLSGSSPYSGRYQPALPLSALDGKATAQTWQLRIDNTGVTPVELIAWSFTVTYAGCVPDTDGDGVPDAKDACRILAGHTVSGCPRASTSTTLRWRSAAWHGRVGSSAAKCRPARVVKVYRVRSGPDRLVRSARTRADGSWRAAMTRRSGRYYAVVVRKVIPGVAECATGRSRTLRL
jgi:hypothetical protein